MLLLARSVSEIFTRGSVFFVYVLRSKEAIHNTEVIYSLVENCRKHRVPLEAYLRELLTSLPGLTDAKTVTTLTPTRIADIRHGKSAAV